VEEGEDMALVAGQVARTNDFEIGWPAHHEEVTASTGQRVRLPRPLDFMVVAGHPDNKEFFPNLFAGRPEVWPTRQGACCCAQSIWK